MVTLKQLADRLEVHPYDLTGDAELAEELMHEDISDTPFYLELIEIERQELYDQTHFTEGISI